MIDSVSVPQHRFEEGATNFHHEIFRNDGFRTHTRHRRGVLAQSTVSRDSQRSIHNLPRNGSSVSSRKSTAPIPVCPMDIARAKASRQSKSKRWPVNNFANLQALAPSQN